ncbi:hypothetical protein [Mammaliicoccus lentus]|uniref:hypothetical protein n=1 Tax=Mammaliicoccus lentus TaxID=42858 RepID=UPI001C502302|nr:hypothetical protein [Mammaliicoccus lentus]MBW0761338.1 hypothetical protein [Mammaliicoccus lentus]MEB8093177.1 hypothetical protein [Mammaliicoccus lentus]
MGLKNKSGVFFDEKEVYKWLENSIGKKRIRKIYDEALIKAGEKVKDAIQANLKYFRDTGAEYGEIKLSNPMWENGLRSVRIYWEGPKNRYSIIHLNEKGFHTASGKFIKPRGYAAIEKALRSAEKLFYKTIQEEIERYI